MSQSTRAMICFEILAALLFVAWLGIRAAHPSGWVAELRSHPGCYVDASNEETWEGLWTAPLPDRTSTWTGACSGRWADGAGVLTVEGPDARCRDGL